MINDKIKEESNSNTSSNISDMTRNSMSHEKNLREHLDNCNNFFKHLDLKSLGDDVTKHLNGQVWASAMGDFQVYNVANEQLSVIEQNVQTKMRTYLSSQEELYKQLDILIDCSQQIEFQERGLEYINTHREDQQHLLGDNTQLIRFTNEYQQSCLHSAQDYQSLITRGEDEDQVMRQRENTIQRLIQRQISFYTQYQQNSQNNPLGRPADNSFPQNQQRPPGGMNILFARQLYEVIRMREQNQARLNDYRIRMASLVNKSRELETGRAALFLEHNQLTQTIAQIDNDKRQMEQNFQQLNGSYQEMKNQFDQLNAYLLTQYQTIPRDLNTFKERNQQVSSLARKATESLISAKEKSEELMEELNRTKEEIEQRQQNLKQGRQNVWPGRFPSESENGLWQEYQQGKEKCQTALASLKDSIDQLQVNIETNESKQKQMRTDAKKNKETFDYIDSFYQKQIERIIDLSKKFNHKSYLWGKLGFTAAQIQIDLQGLRLEQSQWAEQAQAWSALFSTQMEIE